jgi:hypothetical protein
MKSLGGWRCKDREDGALTEHNTETKKKDEHTDVNNNLV